MADISHRSCFRGTMPLLVVALVIGCTSGCSSHATNTGSTGGSTGTISTGGSPTGSGGGPARGSGGTRAAGGGVSGSGGQGSPGATGGAAVAGGTGGGATSSSGGATGTGGSRDAGAPDIAGVDSASEGAGGSGVTDTTGDGDFMIAGPYRPAPELTVAAGVPRRTATHFTLSSSVSAIYPTDVATGAVFTRDVWVYVPAQYVAGTAAPFMVVQDGAGYVNRLPPILDNMINDHRLPVMVAILINPGPGDGIGSERGREYDTVSDAYVRFVETEILPVVKSMFNVTLTTDPEGRAALGQSSGGTAAFTMGWFRPDLYHRILTYSGSFVALGASATYPHGAWEYHEHLIAESAVKPLRVFLEAAQNDNTVANVTHDLNPALSAFYGWLPANMAMAAALKAKGYHYRYIYAAGAGHADGNVIGQTLPEELLWLWRGYPVN